MASHSFSRSVGPSLISNSDVCGMEEVNMDLDLRSLPSAGGIDPTSPSMAGLMGGSWSTQPKLRAASLFQGWLPLSEELICVRALTEC